MRRQTRKSGEDPERVCKQPDTLGPARIIRDASGKEIKQYPARVRHHGTDAEKKLSPEE